MRHPGSPGEEGASRKGGDQASLSAVGTWGAGKGHWLHVLQLLLLFFSCSALSDSLGPHGLQHARLLCLSHLLEFAHTHVCWIMQLLGTVIKRGFRLWFCAVHSRSVVSDSLQPHGLLGPWNSPGKNTGVGCPPPGNLPDSRLWRCKAISYDYEQDCSILSSISFTYVIGGRTVMNNIIWNQIIMRFLVIYCYESMLVW